MYNVHIVHSITYIQVIQGINVIRQLTQCLLLASVHYYETFLVEQYRVITGQTLSADTENACVLSCVRLRVLSWKERRYANRRRKRERERLTQLSPGE